jgi:hypothetical protein
MCARAHLLRLFARKKKKGGAQPFEPLISVMPRESNEFRIRVALFVAAIYLVLHFYFHCPCGGN